MADIKHSTGKKGRKIGRQKKKPSCQRYTMAQRWKKHKATRILRMIKKHPNYKIPETVSSDIASMVRRMLV